MRLGSGHHHRSYHANRTNSTVGHWQQPGHSRASRDDGRRATRVAGVCAAETSREPMPSARGHAVL
eukprot:8634401-Pyramimonas_sp.AAC.1